MKVPNPYLQNIRDLILTAEKYSDKQTIASLEKDQLTFAALDMTVIRIYRYLDRFNELFSNEYPQLNFNHFPHLKQLHAIALMEHQPAKVLQACQIDIPKLKPLVMSILQDLANPKPAEGEAQESASPH